MIVPFRGELSGVGFNNTRVTGEIEADLAGADIAAIHHGSFDWAGNHRFQEGEVCQLVTGPGRFYDIRITDPGPHPVRFHTVS
jgi:hypothetical protein